MRPHQWQQMLNNPHFLIREKVSDPPEIVETHISYVILTTNWAYKIKKTEKLPFLDFSSLEKRRFYCYNELRLNQRLAPAMYLSVIPVQLNQNSIFIGEGKGQIIDYAIKMKRLDNNLEMDRMLQSGKVEHEHIVSLAKYVADFHYQAKVVQVKYSVADFRGWFNPIGDLVDAINQSLGSDYSKLVRRAIVVSDCFIQSNIQKLNERSKTGLVRDLHGDLHSRNIFLTEPPTAFDCIEFDSKLRQIDLLNEIAFLCMDLEYWGYEYYAASFYKNYISQLEIRGLNHVRNELLLVYFKMYRANIRAKVLALQALQDAEPELLWKQVKRYLKLMNHYCSHFSAR